MVTPGVKKEPDQYETVYEDVVTSPVCPMRVSKVKFNSHADYHDVPAGSTIYGTHPRTFGFSQMGPKVKVRGGAGGFTGRSKEELVYQPSVRDAR